MQICTGSIKTNIITETQTQMHGKEDGKFTYQYKHLQLSTSTPKFINWTDIFSKVYVKIESKYLQASINSVHYSIHTCNAIHKHRSKFSLCVLKNEYFVLLVREPGSTEDDSDVLSAIVTHSSCLASLAVSIQWQRYATLSQLLTPGSLKEFFGNPIMPAVTVLHGGCMHERVNHLFPITK